MAGIRRNIAFLYNHDALHQVAHTAPVVSALIEIDQAANVSVISSSVEQEERARELVSPAARARVAFIRLARGSAVRLVERAVFGAAPLRRVARLFDNRALLDNFDAIVTPETTAAMLRTHFAVKRPALIYLPHGAGDRAVGFRRVTSHFDLVLLAGEKSRDRMLDAGIIRADGHAIIGYPKFDTVALDSRPHLFSDDRPVVLYNPHFDPRLSSWWRWGEDILDWFSAQDRYNLVCAPHVMLFRKQLHASVEHSRLRWRRPIPPRFSGNSHVLIDTGSTRSIDMTYTLGADIYLGDASSQIYEFLVRPRPCIFLNVEKVAWRGDPNFSHWTLGHVIESVGELPGALERASSLQPGFALAQQAAFQSTFSLRDTPSSLRAAEAIMSWLNSRPMN